VGGEVQKGGPGGVVGPGCGELAGKVITDEMKGGGDG